MNYNCIFFDFDGVIALNSQILFLQIMKSNLSYYGIDVNESYYIKNFLGWKGENIIGYFNEQYRTNIDVTLLHSIRNEYYDSLINNTEIDDTIMPLLDRLDSCYICSSNKKDTINAILGNIHLKKYFPDINIFCLDDTVKLKPDPMVYNNAINHANYPLTSCCAVEDSATGIMAAKQAGLYAIGYTRALPEGLIDEYSNILIAAGADIVINSFSEIK